jgi:CubicO group peptidase (beta-lactamase class C family)
VFGEVLEAFFSASVERMFRDVVADPVSSAAAYLPVDPAACAATEKGDATEREMAADLGIAYAGFREGVVRGEVHDGNAYRRGGVSAHAGLFGTARDVWRLAIPWLDAGRGDFTGDRTPDLSEARGLAWQGARDAGSVTPGSLSSRAFGHTGFTGTSLWIDPDAESVFILLTNRIHPEVRERDFNLVRRRFHDVATRL